MSNIRYPKELRERATRMVLDALEDNPRDRGAVRRMGLPRVQLTRLSIDYAAC